MRNDNIFDMYNEVININFIIDQINKAKIELNKDEMNKNKVINFLNKIKEELGYKVIK